MLSKPFAAGLLWPFALLLVVLLAVSCDTCDTPSHKEPDIPETVSLSVAMTAWVPASPPSGYAWEDMRMMCWYLKEREVLEEDLYPGAEPRPGQAFIPVLEMDIRDFRYAEPDETVLWAGIQQLLSETGEDISRFDFIEIWLRQKWGEGGEMHIDAGDVSENFYRPWSADSLHTEDKDRDGELMDIENTGYDGVPDGLPGDDPYDNYYFNEGHPDSVRYARINGTEGDPKRYPDTEDLDRDGVLDTDEAHFRFSIDLSDTAFVVRSYNGWVLYRIPLTEAETRGERPTWTSIKYVRLFFTEVERSDRFQIAEILFADSSWAEWLEPYLGPGGGS